VIAGDESSGFLVFGFGVFRRSFNKNYFSWPWLLSWHARKGEVCRHSVLTVVVVLSYLRDVLATERCWMVNAECEWILPDTRVSDHFQIR
jgi:hypothetical protein